MTTEPILTASEMDEALYHFCNLLRIDTSNPPGNEAVATRYISGIFTSEGVPYHVVESAFGRTNLVARLSANNPDNGVLVSAHMDVCPAHSDSWTHPPFDGHIADGFVWGRGTLDMKHMLTYGMMALVIARRRGLHLTKDLAFAAVADEEQGSKLGSLFLAERRPELLRSRYCLTESGGFTLDINGHTIVPVGMATMGYAWLRVTTRGPSGHGAVPNTESAPTRLLTALAGISSGMLEHRLCPSSLVMLDAIAKRLELPQALAIHALRFESLGALGQTFIHDPELAGYVASITHDTVSITRLLSGDPSNEISDTAEAWLDLRVLPGRPVADAVHELRQRLGPNVEVTVLRTGEATVSDFPSPMWKTIERHVLAALPKSHVSPYLIRGFTDAIAYQSLGITTYGFAPVVMPAGLSQTRLVHGIDERIPVEGFKQGFEMFAQVLFDFCTAD